MLSASVSFLGIPIVNTSLEKYDLYIYVLPFNDAPNESVEIMNSII